MRKLFRFKYEPCKGDCYAWCDKLTEELLKLPSQERQTIVSTMVEAHNKLCDNPDYSFGVDLDESTGIFVAHFRTPKSTETFVARAFDDCVRQVCNAVFSTDIPQIEGACIYGDHGAEDLGSEILRACSDIAFRELHHNSCPCHSEVA